MEVEALFDRLVAQYGDDLLGLPVGDPRLQLIDKLFCEYDALFESDAQLCESVGEVRDAFEEVLELTPLLPDSPTKADLIKAIAQLRVEIAYACRLADEELPS